MWPLKLLTGLKKSAPAIGMATGVIAVITFAYNMGGNHREAKLRSELTEQYNNQVQASIDALVEKQKTDIDNLKASHKRAMETAKSEREIITKTETVIKYVDRIKVDPACRNLALDTIGLLQQSTRIGVPSAP